MSSLCKAFILKCLKIPARIWFTVTVIPLFRKLLVIEDFVTSVWIIDIRLVDMMKNILGYYLVLAK